MNSSDLKKYYDKNGYCLKEPECWSEDFLINVKSCKNIVYDRVENKSFKGLAPGFKNSKGKYKHLRNLHKTAPFQKLLRSSEVASFISDLFPAQRMYITHSKASFKEVGDESEWLPHQDNGYKTFGGEKPRSGVALGVFLEDCDEENGTLTVFPGSHLLGNIKHVKVDSSRGENFQVKIDPLPKNVEPFPLVAKQATVAAWSLDTIHQSGNNKKGGCRAIFIIEIEPFTGRELEENSRWPIVLNGGVSLRENIILCLRVLSVRTLGVVGLIKLVPKVFHKIFN